MEGQLLWYVWVWDSDGIHPTHSSGMWRVCAILTWCGTRGTEETKEGEQKRKRCREITESSVGWCMQPLTGERCAESSSIWHQLLTLLLLSIPTPTSLSHTFLPFHSLNSTYIYCIYIQYEVQRLHSTTHNIKCAVVVVENIKCHLAARTDAGWFHTAPRIQMLHVSHNP